MVYFMDLLLKPFKSYRFTWETISTIFSLSTSFTLEDKTLELMEVKFGWIVIFIPDLYIIHKCMEIVRYNERYNNGSII